PVTQKLYLTTQIQYQLVYANASHNPVKPRRMLSTSYIKLKEEIKAFTKNPSDVDTYFQLEKTDVFTGAAFAPDEFPNFNGQAVEYVIITNETLKDGFQEIADWKTHKGMPAVVRTVEWIYDYYPGVDQAEKIRNFIIDAYQNWGVQYVVLGGDSDIIPIRFAWFGPYWELAPKIPNGEFIPADMYFACLEGNWNADGDAIFGESDWSYSYIGLPTQFPGEDFDEVDRLPDIKIGRIPVEDYLVEGDLIELNRFKAKFFEYIKTSQGNENNVMLFSQDEGNVWSWRMDEVGDQFPASCNITKLYQKPPYNNTNVDVLNAMNSSSGTSYHIISGFGHGGATSFNACVGSLNRTHMDDLTNSDRGVILYNNHCSTMGWDKNSISEHFINAEKGGITYIGYTRFGLIYSPTYYCQYFIQHLYNDNNIIGGSFNFIKEKYHSNNYYDNLDRYEFFSLNMSSDPELNVWTDSPDPQNPLIVSVPASIYTGEQTIVVGLDNLAAGVEAKVCLYREGEIYARQTVTGTGSPVTAYMNCTPDTEDDLNDILVTVSAKNYLPVETSIAVFYNPGIHLFASQITVDDDAVAPSNGNNDGLTDAGETAELVVSLTNNGLLGATGGNAILSYIEPVPPNGYITVTQSQAGFGNISSIETVACSTAFVINISTETPDQYLAAFELSITDGQQNTYTDEIFLEIHAPDPQLISNTFTTTQG
nr:hypothetical protein [Bacteroidota bacterium]